MWLKSLKCFCSMKLETLNDFHQVNLDDYGWCYNLLHNIAFSVLLSLCVSDYKRKIVHDHVSFMMCIIPTDVYLKYLFDLVGLLSGQVAS